MPLETPTYVNDLVATNPVGTDEHRFGDDHIRNLKTALKNTFPDATGPLRPNRVLLATATGAAPSYAFTSFDAEPRYKSFEFNIEGLLPVNNAVDLHILASTNNGVSYASSAYIHTRGGFQSNGVVSAAGAGPTSEIVVCTGISNDAPNVHNLDGFFRVYTGASVFTVIHWSVSFIGSGGFLTLIHGYGKYGVGVNALKFLYSSGNIAAGTIRVYGII